MGVCAPFGRWRWSVNQGEMQKQPAGHRLNVGSGGAGCFFEAALALLVRFFPYGSLGYRRVASGLLLSVHPGSNLLPEQGKGHGAVHENELVKLSDIEALPETGFGRFPQFK